MKLVHTADLHLDRCFADSGLPPEVANRQRRRLRETFRRIVRRAGDWPADALLISGDLFEQDRVDPETIAFLAAEFAAIGHVPVFVAPGDRDPYTRQSPYAMEKWPSNVTVFRGCEWQSHIIEEVHLAVHGFGHDGADASQGPVRALSAEVMPDDCVNVLVAHGVAPKGGSDKILPLELSDAVLDKVQYLALGHRLETTPLQLPFGGAAYCAGAADGLGFHTPGPHHYVEVEIAGGEVSPLPVLSGESSFRVVRMTLDDAATAESIEAQIRGEGGLDRAALIRLELLGPRRAAHNALVSEARERLASQVEFLAIVDRTDWQEPSGERFAPGAFALASRRLAAEREVAGDVAGRRRLLRAMELLEVVRQGGQLKTAGEKIA